MGLITYYKVIKIAETKNVKGIRNHGRLKIQQKQENARIVASGVLHNMKYKWTIQNMDVLLELN